MPESGALFKHAVARSAVDAGLRHDRLRDAEHEVISAVARGYSLGVVLTLACRRLESLVPGAICSILLLDSGRTRFTLGAAPSLPAAYNDALEGLVIGDGVGSCGTAAFRRQTVIVNDIAEDPKWAAFRDLALAHDLGACWSIPLLDAANLAIGTFAVYHRRPHRPDGLEIEVANVLSATVAVAITREADRQALLAGRAELESRVVERTRALESVTEEAIRANSFKSRFLAAASHDLRQPLQAIEAYVASLEHRLDNPAQRNIFAKIRAPLESMKGTLNALLDLSRFESGAVVPQDCDFDVGALIDRVITANQSQVEAKGLRLNSNVGHYWVHSDPDLLTRVIDNFVSNAIRYTARGTISITAALEAGAVKIAVADTGIGIPLEACEKIFEEYVQLDNSNRDRRKGLGLGLSIVKLIAKMLDHRIAVESRVGEGSTFSIEVPQALRPQSGSPAAAAELPKLRGPETRLVVLLIEDDPDVADSVSEYLRFSDCEVRVVTCGDEALDAIAEGYRPSVIVSDFRLPGPNGVNVIGLVREKVGIRLPAVLLTGDTTPDTGDRGALASCTVMRKPVGLNDLLDTVRRMAAESRPSALN